MQMNTSSRNKGYLPTPRLMGFAELLDTTFSLYRAHFLKLLGIVTIYFLTMMIGGSLSFLRFTLVRGTWLAIWLPILFVIFSMSIVVICGLISATFQAYVYGKIRGGEALKRSIQRFFPCFFGILLYGLLGIIIITVITLPLSFTLGGVSLTFFSGLLLIVSGIFSLLVFIYVSVYFLNHWCFMVAAVLIEGKSMREGIRRRRELVSRQSMRTVWITVAIVLIYFVIGFILRFSLALVLGLIGIIDLEEMLNRFGSLLVPQFPIIQDSSIPDLILYITQVSVDTVTLPIWIIGSILLYLNHRIRREGFDIEILTFRQGYRNNEFISR